MQYKAVQGVFNDRPAGQACQRQARHFQPLRTWATNEQCGCQHQHRACIKSKICKVSRVAMFQ